MIAQLQQSASVKDFIADAVQSGKVVTIHEKPVSMSGWTGAGYSVIDPDTGAGGYLIEGKGNGGVLVMIAAILLAVIIGMLLVTLGSGILPLVMFGISSIITWKTFLDGTKKTLDNPNLSEDEKLSAIKLKAFIAGLAVVFSQSKIAAAEGGGNVTGAALMGVFIGQMQRLVDSFITWISDLREYKDQSQSPAGSGQ